MDFTSICHLQTSVKLYKILGCVNLNNNPLHFFRTSLSFLFLFLWLPSILPQPGKGSIESLMRYYLFIFPQTPASAFLFSLQFGSLGFRLWHCQRVGVIPQKAGKVRCRDEERFVISHLTAHYMECWPCPSGGGNDTQRYDFQFCGGSCLWVPVTPCIVTLNLLILHHWLVGPSSTKRHSTRVDWSKTMSTPFTQRPPEACKLTWLTIYWEPSTC